MNRPKVAYLALAYLALFVAVTMIASCTENERARKFGGVATKQLPRGEKLIGVTWKDTDLWYLTRARRADEKPETYKFKQDSPYGVVSGEVTIIEQ